MGKLSKRNRGGREGWGSCPKGTGVGGKDGEVVQKEQGWEGRMGKLSKRNRGGMEGWGSCPKGTEDGREGWRSCPKGIEDGREGLGSCAGLYIHE